ncbi:MAG: redoxin domain-containing protein [Acidimicrobiia bacterium]
MKVFAISMLVALVAGACGGTSGSPSSPAPERGGPSLADDADSPTTAESPSATSTTTTVAASDLPDLGLAADLEELDGWLQSDVTTLDELRGKVVVVQFWTFGCHNCKATLPNLEVLYADHAGDDFEIVGVHSPEFDYEKDSDSISAAAEKLGVTWPIALDTNRHNFHTWQGSPAYWPRTYVLDREGHIRFDHIGEGAYDELNQTVATLLG